jgi:hypothetical protein
MFRALLVGLGSMCVIALMVIGLRQVDLSGWSAQEEVTSPILTQADGDARYLRPTQLNAELAAMRQALSAERQRREAVAAQAEELRSALADLQRAFGNKPVAPAGQPVPQDGLDSALLDRIAALERLQQQNAEQQRQAQASLSQRLAQAEHMLAALGDQETPDSDLGDKLRAVELDLQLVGDDLAVLSGRMDRMVQGTGSIPPAPITFQGTLTCAPDRLDPVVRDTPDARLKDLYDACQDRGGGLPNLQVARNKVKCLKMTMPELCLAVERVYLERRR